MISMMSAVFDTAVTRPDRQRTYRNTMSAAKNAKNIENCNNSLNSTTIYSCSCTALLASVHLHRIRT